MKRTNQNFPSSTAARNQHRRSSKPDEVSPRRLNLFAVGAGIDPCA